MNKKTRKRSLWPQSTTPVEWAAGVLGLLLLAGMVGYLSWYGAMYANGLPEIVVEIEETKSVRGGYHVEFSARNIRGATAAQLDIEGELQVGADIVERKNATIDFLPGYSTRKGGMFFRNDPGKGLLNLRATSYQQP